MKENKFKQIECLLKLKMQTSQLPRIFLKAWGNMAVIKLNSIYPDWDQLLMTLPQIKKKKEQINNFGMKIKKVNFISKDKPKNIYTQMKLSLQIGMMQGFFPLQKNISLSIKKLSIEVQNKQNYQFNYFASIDSLIERYLNGEWLTADELRFIANTSELLNSCVDKD